MLTNDHDLLIAPKRDAQGLITQGVVLGDITSQNQELIIISEKGEFKHSPLVGVGVTTYLDDEVPDNLLRAVRTELAVEGMNVSKVRFDSDGKLIIDAQYN